MAGKTLEQIAAAWKTTPVEAYMRMIKATESETEGGRRQWSMWHGACWAPLIFADGFSQAQVVGWIV
jgi:hypothetical protein